MLMLEFLSRAPVVILALLLALLFPVISANASSDVNVEFPDAKSTPVRLGGVLKDSNAWTSYRNRFVDDMGRIADTGNGGVSHSEGQGYGMLLAAAASDRRAFDAIWSWTDAHLFVRRDELAAWKWSETTPRTLDTNNASDGDILIAWALAEAADLWNDAAYLDAARAITRDIVAKSLRSTPPYGLIVTPAVRGFSEGERLDGPVVNLSYWVFPAFARLAQVEPAADWRGVIDAGLALTEKGRFGPMRLPPDWLALGGSKPAPALGFDKRFSYDAMRIPLYLFWAGLATPERAEPFAEAWPTSTRLVELDDQDRPGDSPGAGSSGALEEPGYRAVAALARCAASRRPYPAPFYRFTEKQNYYPATLHLLSLVAAATRAGSCLDRAAIRAVISPDWRPTPGSLEKLAAPAVRPSASRATESADFRREAAFAGESNPFDWRALIENALPARDDLIFYLRAAAGVAVAVLGLSCLVPRRNTQPPDKGFDQKEALISNAVSAVEPAMAHGLSLIPRSLPHSPFTPSSNAAQLGQEIEIAAQACIRLSCTLGLIYFEIPSFEKIERQHGAQMVDAMVARLAGELRQSIRATDHVAILDRKQIVVCICLLSNATDLESIAERLYSLARRHGLGIETAGSAPVGYAIYPLHGYEGRELIDSARSDFRRQNFATEISLTAVEPASLMTSKRVQARREIERGNAPGAAIVGLTQESP